LRAHHRCIQRAAAHSSRGTGAGCLREDDRRNPGPSAVPGGSSRPGRFAGAWPPVPFERCFMVMGSRRDRVSALMRALAVRAWSMHANRRYGYLGRGIDHLLPAGTNPQRGFDPAPRHSLRNASTSRAKSAWCWNRNPCAASLPPAPAGSGRQADRRSAAGSSGRRRRWPRTWACRSLPRSSSTLARSVTRIGLT
jgi:hypothetical protein